MRFWTHPPNDGIIEGRIDTEILMHILTFISVSTLNFVPYVSTHVPDFLKKNKRSNYMHYKIWDELTYPFLNFNGCTVEVYEWISNFIPHFIMDVITYPWLD